jgi:hypothetical protein
MSEYTSLFKKFDHFKEIIRQRKKNRALEKAWIYRNIDHGEVLMMALELKYIGFQQNIFIKETKEITDKLTRIGFVPLSGFPDERSFEEFSWILYNSQYNIAISLYKKEHEHALMSASTIVDKSISDQYTALPVFLAAVKTLLNSSPTETNKQVLLG